MSSTSPNPTGNLRIHVAAAGLLLLLITVIALFWSFPKLLVYALLAVVAALAYGALYLILAAWMDPKDKQPAAETPPLPLSVDDTLPNVTSPDVTLPNVTSPDVSPDEKPTARRPARKPRKKAAKKITKKTKTTRTNKTKKSP